MYNSTFGPLPHVANSMPLGNEPWLTGVRGIAVR